MTEADFQAQVIDLLHILGYRVAHFRPAQTKHGWRTPVAADGAGFPDLIAVRGLRFLVTELKTNTGRVSRDQDAWLTALRAAGVETYVWRPSDLSDIARILSDRVPA